MADPKLHDVMAAVSKAVLEWHESMRPSLEAASEAVDQIAKNLQQALANSPLFIELAKIPSEVLTVRLAAAQDFMWRLPEEMGTALRVLAEAGWYLDPEMSLPDIFELEKGLRSGDPATREHWLINHYTGRIPEIQATLERRHPRRAKILGRAFAAHVREEYELSVPVFLIQADGICQEILKLSPYGTRDRQDKLIPYIRSLVSDDFQAAALYPLSQPLPLTATKHERDAAFAHLNRHQVLHGESVDYGTRVNSLKAISFINYVSFVLSHDAAGP
jgi:hypothetical protein